MDETANAYRVLGKPAKQMKALEKAKELAPKNIEILLLYGRTLRAAAGNRQTSKSIAAMRRVLDLDPNNLEALVLVACGSQPRANRRGEDIDEKGLGPATAGHCRTQKYKPKSIPSVSNTPFQGANLAVAVKARVACYSTMLIKG